MHARVDCHISERVKPSRGTFTARSKQLFCPNSVLWPNAPLLRGILQALDPANSANNNLPSDLRELLEPDEKGQKT